MRDFRLRLLDPQIELVEAQETNVLYSGGYGAGKTHGLAVRQVTMSSRFPSVPHGLASPTKAGSERDVKQAVRDILEDLDVKFEEHKTHHWIQPEWCTARRGAAGIHFASCDKPNSLKGPNWGTVGINEPGIIKREAYDVLRSRCRISLLECATCGAWRGDERKLLRVQPKVHRTYDLVVECPTSCGSSQVTVAPNYVSLAGTPEGFNWLYDEWIDESQHPKRDWSDWRRIYADTGVNVFSPSTYREGLLETFDAELADEKVRGKFVNVRKGAVYRSFDRAKHVRETCAYDPTLPLHFSWDFNVDPLCTVIAQLHGKGTLWFIDEIIAPGGGKTAEVMDAFAARYGGHAAGIVIHGDRSGRNRDTRSAGLETDYDVIRQKARLHGLKQFSVAVADSNPAVRDRIARVNGVFKNAAGQVRGYVHPQCRNFIRDLEQQVYKPGTVTPDDADGKLGHSADAGGYVTVDLIKLPSREGGTVRVRA